MIVNGLIRRDQVQLESRTRRTRLVARRPGAPKQPPAAGTIMRAKRLAHTTCGYTATDLEKMAGQ